MWKDIQLHIIREIQIKIKYLILLLTQAKKKEKILWPSVDKDLEEGVRHQSQWECKLEQ